MSLGGVNAIHRASEEIRRLTALKLNKKHKLLGLPIIQITLISGGIKPNIIPDYCEFTIHIRSAPIYSNDYLINLIKKNVKSKIKMEIKRYLPNEVGIEEEIVRSAKNKKASSNSKIVGFPAASGFAFINKARIVLGSGRDLEQDHWANKFIENSQLQKAKEIYKKIIQNYLSFLNSNPRKGIFL